MTVDQPAEACEPDALPDAFEPLREVAALVDQFRIKWNAWTPAESTLDSHLDAVVIADEVERHLLDACAALSDALLALDDEEPT